jgi:hypothetical protein
MKNKSYYGFNSGVRFLTFTLAFFFAVLAVFDEYKDQGSLDVHEELVSEKEFDFAVFPSSLTRPTTSKLTKIERTAVVKIFHRVFSVELANPQQETLIQPQGMIFSNFVSLISKSEILTNAP